MKLCCWMAVILAVLSLALLASGVALAQGPVISNVQAGNVTATSAVITWTTDQLADSTVVYGNSTPPGSTVSDSSYVTDHAVPLAGLTSDMQYFFEVRSANQTGNTTIDNNGGIYYTFSTLSAPQQYTLTVNTVGNGTVSKIPDQAIYDENDVVQVSANPDPGWSFSSWSGDLSGSTNPDAITMDSDKTVTATFTQVVRLEGWVWCSNFGSISDATFDGTVVMVDRALEAPSSSLHVTGNLSIERDGGPVVVDLDMYGSRVRSLFYLRQEVPGRSVSLNGTWIDADSGEYYIWTSGVIGLPNTEGQELKTGKLCFLMLRTPDVEVPLPEGGDFVTDLESIVTRFTRLIDRLWDSLIGTGFREVLGSVLSQMAVMIAALRDALGGSYVP